MASDKAFPQSGLPIRRTVDFLPDVFKTDANEKFFAGTFDPLIQPGVLERTVGYIGRRYGKTYSGASTYLDTDNTLRSAYQLEPGVVIKNDNQDIVGFNDYLDLKNQLKFFGSHSDRDDKLNFQEHYSWNPPIDWDKFVNYREYYWLPLGPAAVPVRGQTQAIQSTYKVKTGTVSSWIFTPDGYTDNPDLTLYRGQTYNFNVNSTEGFTIRSNYDTGSLLYNPNKVYFEGDLAVYEGELWRANTTIEIADGSSITVDSQDWDLVDDNAGYDSLDYIKGITNNGAKKGIVVFDVPLDAPDILYYQSATDPTRLGKFIIADIEENTYIDVENEIVGKETYTSSNGIEFTNGLIVEFLGGVYPDKYATSKWLVEGVGKEIALINFDDLVPPVLSTETPEVLYDNDGFDTQPFDDASAFPYAKDYITVSRSSADSNPWSRYNRWFHRTAIDIAYAEKGRTFEATEEQRAKRPIIEFLPNIQLFNHGTIAKQTVDYVDTYTTDVFSKIEGSTSYNVDGEYLFEGARILVINDTDTLANNKIYEVNFVTHNSRRQINLKEIADTVSYAGDCVLVRRGIVNAGKMFHFNGSEWLLSQEKTAVNQAPLYDVFDENGVSLADEETYPSSTFDGTKIVSYKEGNGPVDSELGFALSYQNINNVGDIEFNWDWDIDEFQWTVKQIGYSKKIAAGFYKTALGNENGWIKTSNDFIQPIVDSTVLIRETTAATLFSVNWEDLEAQSNSKVNFYLNGFRLHDTYTRVRNTFTFDNTTFKENDVLSVKIIANVEPNEGYYEIPVGLERNPLNEDLTVFTLGQATDHLSTSLEFNDKFDGVIPGRSNLRDLGDYQQHAKRFMKHAGLTPLAINFLCSKTNNVIKAIQYAKNSYSSFKNNFLRRAMELDYNENIADFVDEIINSLTIAKSIASPFADNDMIGSGAFNSIDYVVEDEGIKTFALSEKFDLTELSRRAVYVYYNGVQILHGRDYTFNSTFGFVTLSIDLVEGDKIQIREYVSTAFCHIPPTPTKLGMYRKYTPRKFLDDTYIEPREMIQGHDGSLVSSYGDYRDDLLLELEYRIYNNVKVQYDPRVFDNDSIVSSYYGHGLYDKQDLDDIVSQEFLKWVNNTNINYTINEYFDSEDSFTYTYSNMTDPTGSVNLPGWWRGVYSWFYDTVRPHTCPWEMLGFSEKPTWWEDEYGAAPYTKGNLILWEDLEAGIVRQGENAGIYDRYKRPGLTAHIPVDDDGKLLSPLQSGLATNFTLINNRGSFKLGDQSPAEYAWRTSSEWPYATIIAMALLRPFDFITANLNRATTTRNLAGQLVDTQTYMFQTTTTVDVPVAGEKLASGLMNYIVSYNKSNGLTSDKVIDEIENTDVMLSTRLSGFVDKEKQRYLLDSKNPSSSSSNIYIPYENYNVIFNVSTPIKSVTYSGVILQKVSGGWAVNGYDDIQPYFNYYSAVPNQKDPMMSIGGVSEAFTVWETEHLYNNGTIVQYKNDYFRCLTTHMSGTDFETNKWSKLPKLPQTGSVDARRRRNFNKLKVKRLSYGSQLNSVQEVVDFLLGYEEYLKGLGFIFENYDPENQVSQDFTTACKEFMFWTKHNWALNSLITLSPAAQVAEVNIAVGVADNLLDSFYQYNILSNNGQPIDPKFINVTRDFKKIKISTVNTTDGLYFIKFYYVLKEHVTVFDHKTVFNDTIFNKETGYRQERIKTQGYRTSDWDGDYTSPGFVFDNVTIDAWSPFTDYRLGDIVSYKSKYWTSKKNQNGVETFNENNWTILDSNPEKQLIPNFDFKIKEFEDYYEVSSDGISTAKRDLARHTIGYQTRNYLENLAEDPVTQFQLYQGFIREKGTPQSISKVFDKLTVRQVGGSVDLHEEWAFRVGQLGGVEQNQEIEIELYKENFELNPQPLLIVKDASESYDKIYRIPEADFTIKQIPFSTDIIPTASDIEEFLTAGYVKLGQIDWAVKSRDDILNINIASTIDNDHFWITFDGISWTVLRLKRSEELLVTGAILDTDTTVILQMNRPTNIKVGDIIGIKTITNVTGFFKVVDLRVVDLKYSIVIEVPEGTKDPEIDDSSYTVVYTFDTARYASYDDLQPEQAAILKNGAKLWIDNNDAGLWEVVQKQKQYSPKAIGEFGTTDPLRVGYKVLYNSTTTNTLVSMPSSGYVMSYIEMANTLEMKQIIAPPAGYDSKMLNSFGEAMALSPDNKWLAIGAPRASAMLTYFTGDFNPYLNYAEGDIVLYNGRLWKARKDVNGDGSSINVYTEDWEPATVIEAYETADEPGFTQQGMVALYEYAEEQWNHRYTVVSPRPAPDELFGSNVVLSKTATGYTMAVSATGAMLNKGRVYIFDYTTANGWSIKENQNYKGYYNPGATFTGSFATLPDGRPIVIVTGLHENDYVDLEMVLAGAGVPDGITITNQYDGTRRGNGTYLINREVDPITVEITGTVFYPKDSIVWFENEMWLASVDTYGNTHNISTLSDWMVMDPVATQSSLPSSISVEDDGSTLASGIITPDQHAELIKAGDEFGTSLATNYDGSVLLVGVPKSDGQYFATYKGIWRPDVEYLEGDVVSYNGFYHKLINDGTVPEDSVIASYNQEPISLPWQEVGDSSRLESGKVFVYRLNNYGFYSLEQTIDTDSLSEISDIDPDQTISSGDRFGHSISIDHSGNTFVVSSPKADINFQNQGSAYIFKYESDSSLLEFRLKQKIESYEQFPSEYFGQSVSISPNSGRIVVGANNTPYVAITRFDNFTTSFDEARTAFVSEQGFAGSVYVYELRGSKYFLTEKLEDDLSLSESFGWSVACTDSVIVVGSPTYKERIESEEGLEATYGPETGTARLFKKDPSVNSWTTLARKDNLTWIDKVKSVSLYDNVNNVKIQDIELLDPVKMRILSTADQEIRFQTLYDPAVYTVGTDDVIVDSDTAWTTKNVGQLWWDISTVKWLQYEQGDLAYRTGNWNRQAEGSSVDVYEWVESPLLPSEWYILADTTEGLAEGISGTPKNIDDSVYSVKHTYNPVTGAIVSTMYYYWVKNTVVTPQDVIGRRISAAQVTNIINDPAAQGMVFAALVDSDAIVTYNFGSVITTDTALLNIQLYKNIESENNVHNEYQLLTEGIPESEPTGKLEAKWIDSLAGYDLEGNTVPDPYLPAKQKYGLAFRPRQSMFINRLPLLKMLVDKINTELMAEPFANTISFDTLGSVEQAPSKLLNLYDTAVGAYIDLQTVGTIRVRQAILKANIVDGSITTIDIVNPGYGYKVAPPVEFEGNGTGATATTTIDNQGRINSVTVITPGKKYSTAIAKIRPFSVLVEADENSNGFWGIYAWDSNRQSFYRTRSQAYDTTRYWQYKDWWKDGYGITSRITKEVLFAADEAKIKTEVGDLIKIKEYGAGGWAVFEKIAETAVTPFDNYILVGRYQGTIEVLPAIYDTTLSGIGYDNARSFDTGLYDIENSKELRNILQALKEDIFVGIYKVKWNELFFASIRYALAEQQYVDWVFKTSFLNATHTVGCFCRRPNYKSDGLDYFRQYIDEVKPFRTTVRKYTSKYDEVENTPTAFGDFDLPPAYIDRDGAVLPITERSDQINSYPWKLWLDNKGFEIESIEVAAQGEQYSSIPRVLIEGDGSGATAQAFVTNGKISAVKVIEPGFGYTYATVTLVGGNPNGAAQGKAVAMLGNAVARTFDVGIKFDRLAKTGFYQDFNFNESFTATGQSSVFNLTYAPNRDKSKITVTIDGQVVLGSDYNIDLYTSAKNTSFNLLKGILRFSVAPGAGSVVEIAYEKNDNLFDSINRIEKYYAPSTGMKGKELNQLMTGFDFGGVQVQGTTFDVTGGWDALPWFTDGWDSVDAASDYYVVCDGSTNYITLPYVPADGQIVTIYLKRYVRTSPRTIDDLQYDEGIPDSPILRIDDPNYTESWDSSVATNPHAQMPTFVGDGSSSVVEIGRYISTDAGDILIFRPAESDGSVTITDPNLLDTRLSGGTLSTMSGAYTTATGTSAEEIVIEGGKFISPDQVQAPEESVPGQVLDSVSIKVFQNSIYGAAAMKSKIILADGSTKTFSVGQTILENKSVIVYVNRSKMLLTTDYDVDFTTNSVILVNTPAEGDTVEILSVNIGGIELLDYQKFIADGETGLFQTNADYNVTTNVFVTVNGEEVDAGFINSTDVTDSVDRTVIQFAELPPKLAVINIVCMGVATDVDSTQKPIVRVHQEVTQYEGSTRSVDIESFVDLSRGSPLSSIIVEVNDVALQGPDTIYAVYDGTNNQFTLGTDPEEAPGAILPSNIKVFINNERATFIQDYVYDGTTKELTIEEEALSIGDSIKIENDFRAEFEMFGNNILIHDDVPLVYDDQISVTWFGEYPSMDIVSDEHVGGKVYYELSRAPLDAAYVWVYKNGERLSQDIDYSVSIHRQAVYLLIDSTTDDLIKIVLFGSKIYRLPSSYEIQKDMLNVYHFKRFSENDVVLAKDLYYYDLTIEVNDATNLDIPVPHKNQPGVVVINGEKIEYMQKTGNILSQLRRGANGTAIKDVSLIGTAVVNAGASDTIPYAETQDRYDFYSDGSSTLIGPLGFVPEKSTTADSWYRDTIPSEYGQCDTLEVFAAGRRMRKSPVSVFDETLGAVSPAGDKQIEAEFTVNGSEQFIRLTETLPAGTRISVIKRTGKTWYDRGATTATSGETLLENTSPIAQFIAQKTTKLPE